MPAVWWVIIGGLALSVVGVQIATRVARTGRGHLLPGRGTDRSTSDALRRFRRQGWRLLRDAAITHGREIDHIAVGPAGVVVVETTWRRSLTMNDLALAAKLVRRSRDEVESVLTSDFPRVPIIAVVVTWGHDRPGSVPAVIDGVRVVRGEEFAIWFSGLPDRQLTVPEIRRAAERLTEATVEHDLYDRREHHVPAGCTAPESRGPASSAA